MTLNICILNCVLLLIIFAFAITVDSQSCGERKEGRGFVVGGKYIERGSFPWITALINNDNLVFCGGTILSKTKVLTAAHCIRGKNKRHEYFAGDVRVILGSHNLSDPLEIGKIVYGVENIQVHREWNVNSKSYDADIAMLTLTDDIHFSRYIQPICLIEPGSSIEDIIIGYSVGYGQSEDETKIHENVPKFVKTPIQGSNEECFYTNDVLLKISSRRTFCGGSRDGTGVCLGDSGNGLFVEHNNIFYLRGIVSSSLMASFSCDNNNYSVYTNVLKFREWINNQIDSWGSDHIYYPPTFESIFKTTTRRTSTTTKRETTERTITSTFVGETEGERCGKAKLGLPTSIGGTAVVRGAYPWNAALLKAKDRQFFCGGTIVSNRNVVTAAHCIVGKHSSHKYTAGDILVTIGAHNLAQNAEIGKQTIAVKNITIHEDWNPTISSFEADIAVLELDEEILFSSYIQPICLMSPGSDMETITTGIVAGFGKSENREVENIARVIKMPIHSHETCSKSADHVSLLGPRMFCGGYANGTGVCVGDTGSGFYISYQNTYYLRGIVSASLHGSLQGCNVDDYSIFTDAMKFKNFIETGKEY